MTVSSERRHLIERLVQDELESEAEYDHFFDTVSDPFELHMFADGFNWDAGPDQLWRVVRHPMCDLGTALMVYWRAQPTYFQKYRTRDEVESYERDLWDLLREVEEGVANKRFSSAEIEFDPRNDHGHDLTQQPLRESKIMWEIPEALLGPLGGGAA